MKIVVTLVNMDFNQVNYIQMENWESHLKAKIHIWTDKYKFDCDYWKVAFWSPILPI